MKKWNRRTRVVVLSAILTLIFLTIYAAGVLLPEELTAPSIRSTRLPPSVAHLFGTDALGRDLFFRTLKGLSVHYAMHLCALPMQFFCHGIGNCRADTAADHRHLREAVGFGSTA